MLLGLMQIDDGVAGQVLTEMGVSLSEASERVQDVVAPGSAAPYKKVHPHRRDGRRKCWSWRSEKRCSSVPRYIDPEHLLLGLIREGEGIGRHILLSFGIELSDVRQRVVGQMTGVGGEVARGQRGRGQRGRALARRVAPTEAVVVICSFCGLHPPESGEMVAGNNAFICERCIRQMVISPRPLQAGPPHTDFQRSLQRGRPGGATHRYNKARAEIEAAFAKHGSLSEDGKAALGVEREPTWVGLSRRPRRMHPPHS